MEALAAGRGLVYAESTVLSEAADSSCGRVADVRDPAALSSTIVAELRSPTSADPGQAQATTLSWDRLVDDYRAIYGRLSSSR